MSEEDIQTMQLILAGMQALTVIIFFVMAHNVSQIKKHLEKKDDEPT